MNKYLTDKNRYLQNPDVNSNRWVRNEHWLSTTTPADNEQKAIILKAVYNSNWEWAALSATGDYTVDWGDGNVEDFASGVIAEHTYDYVDVDLTDTSIELGYKQALIQIYPQVGQSLTSLNLHIRHSVANFIYETGFLDVAIVGANLSSLILGTSSNSSNTRLVVFNLLQSFYLGLNSVTNLNFTCYSLHKLAHLPRFYCQEATSLESCFESCIRLPINLTALSTSNCLNFKRMFWGGNRVVSPTMDTSNGVDLSGMLSSNVRMRSVYFYNTSSATNLSAFLSTCYSLDYVPTFDTSSATNLNGILQNCTLLKEFPAFNTDNATDLGNYFLGCQRLLEIPVLDTSKNTNMNNFMANLISNENIIPDLNTGLVTSWNGAFNNATFIATQPDRYFNASSGTSFANTFLNAKGVRNIYLVDCKYSVSLANCSYSKDNLEIFLNNLGSAATGTQTLTISGNPGTGTITSLSGTTTAGSKTVTFASTTGINVGDRMTGTGSSLTTPLACTFTDVEDLVTVNNHGLSNGDLVSFVTIVTTTGIVVRTPYYVTNATTNTFTVSASVGGATLPLTTNGSGTLIYDAVVESIVPNVSVTLSRPATSTSTSSKSFRALNTAPAVLRGFTISG